MNLTPRQLDVLVYIRQYRQGNGVSPTVQEIGDALGFSKVTAFEHIGALERKSIIRRDKHKARSIEIIGDGKTEPLRRAISEAVTFIGDAGNAGLATKLERLAAGVVL